MDQLSIPHVLLVFVLTLLPGYALYKVFTKAGLIGWMFIIMVVPIIGPLVILHFVKSSRPPMDIG